MGTRSLDVTVKVDPGGAVFSRRFDRFVSDLTDLTPAFEAMAREFYEWEAEAFASRGSSSGRPWAPLSAGYTQWKRAHFPGKGILIRTEDLRRSLVGPKGPGSVHHITDRRMEIGTDVPYARFHQAGTRRMPARPVIRLTEANKQRWTKIVHRHLVQSAAGRFEGAL